MVQIFSLGEVDVLVASVDGLLEFFCAATVSQLVVDVFNHGFGKGEACAFSFADELPVLGAVEQVQGLFVVVEFGLTGGHVPENIMHDWNTLKAIIVINRALIL